MTLTIRTNRLVTRLRLGLADMSYAQRRVLEHQTGVPMVKRSRPIARTASELEALYARDDRSARRPVAGPLRLQ